jgi:serine/threonine protein kinase
MMATEMSARQKKLFQTTFETYTEVGIVGEGGAGRIFKVVDESGKKWALKLMDSKIASKEKSKRFKNEVQFCLKNKHGNIVTIVDHGIYVQGKISSPFYIMPLYHSSMRTLLNSGIPAGKVLKFFADILNGVEAAHLQRVVHRDLKPENILYDAVKDILLVADFGIAHFEEDELLTAVETKDSARLANFQYAAPEQRSRGLKVDSHADIYALGLILNEMFTGQVPHGTGYRTIGQITPEHAYLDDLVTRMLRQSPEERLSSIEEIKQELIGRKNEFISQQHLSELKETVIPVTEIDDPLITDIPRLVNFDWDNGTLTLFLSRPVNSKWIWALQNMGSYSFIYGKRPEHFSVSGDKAVISAQENEVQRVIDYFKEWLPVTTQVYRNKVLREREDEEKSKRQQLELRVKQEEMRQRVLKNVKI